jgi:hypothetical protein
LFYLIFVHLFALSRQASYRLPFAIDRLIDMIHPKLLRLTQRAPKDKQQEPEQALVRSYVGESGVARCRRVVLGGYLDRREVERAGCEEGEERCDVCQGQEAEEEIEEEDNEDPSEVEEIEAGESVGESEGEKEREETQRTFKQQQREQQGPHQTLVQQRQQEFADVAWLRRQLAR